MRKHMSPHGDANHIGDAINLINSFKVKNVIFNDGIYNDLELKLINALKIKNIPHYQSIQTLNIGEDKLHFLNTKEYDDENNNSIVIHTKINNVKMLFMGDAGIEKEKDILNKYKLSIIDILKVGHHGSNTSTSQELINKIKPETCLISVGANNKYGHPNKSILQILNNCNKYRTDNHGGVTIKLQNNSYKVQTVN